LDWRSNEVGKSGDIHHLVEQKMENFERDDELEVVGGERGEFENNLMIIFLERSLRLLLLDERSLHFQKSILNIRIRDWSSRRL